MVILYTAELVVTRAFWQQDLKYPSFLTQTCQKHFYKLIVPKQ